MEGALDEAEILKKYGRHGQLTHLPARQAARVEVLAWLAARFEPGRAYSELEVNDILRGEIIDHVTLRRHLVDYGFLERGGGIYRLAPRPESEQPDSTQPS